MRDQNTLDLAALWQSFHQLRGILVRTGSYSGGHYTAYVRDQGNQWFFCDDQLAPIPVFNTEDILARQAYMLFYESM